MRISLCLLLLCALHAPPLPSQTSISGIVNAYAGVNAIDYCAAKLTVASTTGFQPGQAVLLIQMQGAAINESNSSSFGNITDIGGAGLYERARIAQINGSDIFLEHELVNTYVLSGKVQLVSIPEYASATVTGTLQPQAWNGATGGVLALDVAGTLTLNAPISADARGFRGGQLQVVNSNCEWFLNEDDWYYGSTNWRGAWKGEGVAAYISGKEKGRGAQANGGGGGNDHNAGGGGGAQAATGGGGGDNIPNSTFGCDGDFPGAGGKSLPNTATRIFMGGGGGAGHADDAGSGTGGGAGGGIVIVWAGSIDGQNQDISARGQDVPNAAGDGAGGGGAGGTVVLTYGSAASSFQVLLNGGKGGNTNNFADRCYAPGGGGSGGRLLRNGPAPATLQLAGGIAGVNNTPSSVCPTPQNGATAGAAGQESTLASFPEGTIPIQFPDITQNTPPGLTVCPAQAASLSVQAAGNGLSFQWQVNAGSGFNNLSDNAFYAGTQTATLQLLDPQAGWNGYQYRCLISSACFDPLISNTTVLSVETPAIADFSFSVNGNSVMFTSTSINADSLSWSFGDGGQSSLPNPEHTYNNEGNYLVTLTAFNACGGASISLPVTVGFPPVAGFDADFTGGCAPLSVQFEDLSNGNNINSWNWSFPGGQPASSTLSEPQVLYNTPGVFDVTLIVGNGIGFDTISKTAFIEVVSPPEASFSYTVSGDTVFFQNTSTGGSLVYSWDFGDGSSPSGATNPVHVFPGPGTYEVTLLALTTYCGSATSLFIQVGPNAAKEHNSGILRIFPNPFSETIQVEMPLPGLLDCNIWNAQGRLMLQTTLLEGLNELDASRWPAGMYWIEWRMNGRIYRQKLVKIGS